jgi:pimeloyl-ACP methyl ester carboxylesterase
MGHAYSSLRCLQYGRGAPFSRALTSGEEGPLHEARHSWHRRAAATDTAAGRRSALTVAGSVRLLEQSRGQGAAATRSLVGGTGETLVSLHGAGGLNPDPALELLAAQFHVFAPELPGFGSSIEQPLASFEEVAGQVVGMLDAHGVERCTLVGTSFGAIVALHIALTEANRLDALVLLSPAAPRPAGWTPPIDIDRALFANPSGPRPDAVAPELAERQHALVGRLLEGLDEDRLRARLPAIEVPTLVVCGTEDGLFGPEQGRVYRELMPNCSFVLLYDAAHELGWDRPEALAALIGDFATRRETFVVGVAESRA